MPPSLYNQFVKANVAKMPGGDQKERMKQVAALWRQTKGQAGASRGRGLTLGQAEKLPAPALEQAGAALAPADTLSEQTGGGMRRRGGGKKKRGRGVSKAKGRKGGKKKRTSHRGRGQRVSAWSGGGAAPVAWSGGSLLVNPYGNGNALPRPSQTGFGFTHRALNQMGYGFRGDNHSGGGFWSDLGDTFKSVPDFFSSGVSHIGDALSSDGAMQGLAVAGQLAPIAGLLL